MVSVVMSQLEWRTVSDFPAYEVSNTGLVRRMKPFPGRPVDGRVLKPTFRELGHCTVSVFNDKRRYTVYIHRLVALAFLGPPPQAGMHVAHWNGDATDNCVENLRWATPAENNADCVRLGRDKRPGGENSGKAKLSNVIADQIRSTPEIGCREWARLLGVSHPVISNIRRGISYTHHHVLGGAQKQ